MVIHPTHTCFDDALEYVTELVKAGTDRRVVLQHLIVHGICFHSEVGEPYAHGWVEHGGTVIQGGIIDGEKVYWSCDAEEHYAKLHILDVTRYSLRDAARENVRTGHFGPWEERYRALCRDLRVDESTKGEKRSDDRHG